MASPQLGWFRANSRRFGSGHAAQQAARLFRFQIDSFSEIRPPSHHQRFPQQAGQTKFPQVFDHGVAHIKIEVFRQIVASGGSLFKLAVFQAGAPEKSLETSP